MDFFSYPTASLKDEAEVIRSYLGQVGIKVNLVEQDYAWITQRIKDVAKRHSKGRIVSSLEGGYNLRALARSVEAHIRVLADL